jgi:hypothetical protein
MARERWFFAPTHKRQGPVPLAQLVEALLRLPDPRSCLVWKNGLPAWTPAGDVGDIDRHLAPFVAARKPSAVRAEREAEESAEAIRAEAAAERGRTRATTRAAKAAGPSPLVYMGAGAGALVLAGLVYAFWPKSPPPRPKGAAGDSSPGVITLKEGDPTSGSGTGTGGSATGPGQPGFAGWSDQESNLPNAELSKLRAVAGYAEDSLEVTVYNGGTWRITELLVRRSRLVGDNWVEDDRPLTLLPVGAQVEQGVNKLLDKVAPDRRKPGVNPLDTGKFVGKAGARPEAFKAPIIGARGYPPK